MEIQGHGTGSAVQSGLTVFELIMTLAIAGIILTIGAPSFQFFIQKQRIKSAVGTMHQSLNRARGEALYENTPVIACPGHPEEGCRPGSDWSDGWIVFPDRNGDRNFQPTELPVHHAPGISQVGIHSSAGRQQIRFLAAGHAPGSNTTLRFCALAYPAKARKLVISNIGRIRRDDNKDIDPGLCQDAQ
jgi:type IV fimbrial biogenesis protein FimT